MHCLCGIVEGSIKAAAAHLEELGKAVHVGQEAALDAQVPLLAQVAQHLEQQLVTRQKRPLQQHG